ncbi:oxidoreductase [Roseomonas gilardii]|uniref:Oxidoreductase n=1 Tax=Roseomonas gilardii TaxID=257708 RepID=A0A1L7AMF3_9PROT|nr:FAD-binding oxidoreductase [Roseomonas gilardii]APT59894.1 oxidoreductase [Roseomonas gilardii]
MNAFSARPLPRSLYAATARAPVAAPPLEGEHRASVAVVGGGFTGLSTALHLAESGVDVIVLEAHEPGWGASGRNGGQVNPGLKHDPAEVERDFGPELGRRMVTMSNAAPDKVFSLVQQHQILCEAHQGGTIRGAFHANGLGTIRATAEDNARRGGPVEILDAEGMRRLTGSARYLGGSIDRRGGSVNPLGYARGLADAAQRAGARIHGGSPALRMERQGTSWRIATPGGAVTAEKVVLATNAYSDDLWPGLRRSIVPVFSGIAATEPLPDRIAATIMPDRPVLFEIASLTVYYRLDAWNRLLMGGRSIGRETSDPVNFRRLTRYALRLWPQLAEARWEYFWNGQLAVTTDHYPHLHEPAPGVIACLAYNGRGVAMATTMGEQVARRVMGASQEEIDFPITDLRTIPFHGFRRLGVAARVTYGAIRDRLGL